MNKLLNQLDNGIWYYYWKRVHETVILVYQPKKKELNNKIN